MFGEGTVGRLESDHRSIGGCTKGIGNLGDRVVSSAGSQPGNRMREHSAGVVRSANREVVIPLIMVATVAAIIITPEKGNGCTIISGQGGLGIEGGTGLGNWGDGQGLHRGGSEGGESTQIGKGGVGSPTNGDGRKIAVVVSGPGSQTGQVVIEGADWLGAQADWRCRPVCGCLITIRCSVVQSNGGVSATVK